MKSNVENFYVSFGHFMPSFEKYLLGSVTQCSIYFGFL
jgi:hypothetical protein